MLSERTPDAKESSFQGIKYGTFSEGNHALKKKKNKKNELTGINSLG